MLRLIFILYVFSFFLTCSNLIYAQENTRLHQIQGNINDSLSTIPLENAAVKLLRREDSIFIAFKRSAKDGAFLFSGIKSGHYTIIVSYPNYTDYIRDIALDSASKTIIFKKFNLIPLPKILEEVVVVGKSLITIKGDTIEYDPKSLIIQPNSRVEDLLKQLPGLQVDQNGQITAQGRIVKQVLLDGEEFFGDDPTLITRNIRSDMVGKIQLYDKKSKQAEFTGIDDGRKETTINIELKEDKKNGYFGKVQAGAGTSGFYEGQGMFNKFSNKRKMALFGTAGNTAVLGLSKNDGRKYATSNDIGNGFNSTGMISIDQLEDAKFNGKGIPQVYSGGAHYDEKWRDKKENININYKIGVLEIEGTSKDEEIRAPDDRLFNRVSNERFNDRTFRQVLDGKYENQLDSLSTLRVAVRGGHKTTKTDNDYTSTSYGRTGEFLNSNSRNFVSDGTERFVLTDVLWNRKLKKPGRTISFSMDQMMSKVTRNGRLNSQTIYDLSDSSKNQLIDQRKIEDSDNFNFNSNIVYTEPLSQKVSLSGYYKFNFNKGNALRYSFNNSADGYKDMDSLYSNDFRLKQFINILGLNVTYNNKKSLINLGISGSLINFDQRDKLTDTLLEKQFTNFASTAEWIYRIAAGKSFKASYNGVNILPKIHQLQPLINNIDPLNQTVGNPNLKPSFSHNLTGSYTSYSPITGRTFMLSLNSTALVNDITGNITINENGESVYSYENMESRTPFNYSSYVYYGGKMKSLDLTWGGILNFSHSASFNILNTNINKNSSNILSMYLNLSKSVKSKYDFSLEAGPTFIDNSASSNRDLSSKGWGTNLISSANVYLPWKFSVQTDVNYSYLPATALFQESFSRLIWNASLNKRFLKSEELSLKLGVNDVLNQNKGFNRVSAQGSIVESSYTTIRRYFLVSVVWDFNKNQ